jgi:hypothetical protein
MEQCVNNSQIRELSLNEIDTVAGALKFSIGPVTIAIAEQGVTGISIGGGNGIGVGVVDGQLCGYVGSHGGCIP